jgi:hypothetical protein
MPSCASRKESYHEIAILRPISGWRCVSASTWAVALLLTSTEPRADGMGSGWIPKKARRTSRRCRAPGDRVSREHEILARAPGQAAEDRAQEFRCASLRSAFSFES